MKKSFTLIELLVVIAIIGLLSSIVYVSLSGVREKAQRVKTVSFATQIYRSLGADMVGHWDFNDKDSANIAHDLSGYDNHGDIYGASYKCDEEDATPYHLIGQGKDECSLGFDGNNDYVDVGDDNSLDITGAITISAWVHPKAFDGEYEIIAVKGKSWVTTGDSDFAPWNLGTRNGEVRWQIYEDTNTRASLSLEGSLLLDQWSLVTAVWEGTTNTDNMKIYLNDNLSGTSSQTDVSSLAVVSHDVTVGYDKIRQENRMAWNGSIDNVRIYNRSLESAEIKGLYYAGLNNLLAKEQIDYNEYKELIK